MGQQDAYRVIVGVFYVPSSIWKILGDAMRNEVGMN